MSDPVKSPNRRTGAAVDLDLLRRYDRPGPRYTSYPTAVEFHSDVGPEEYGARLAEAGRRPGPLSLYVHIPFCEHRCLFCGCTTVVTNKREVVAHYLETLDREIDLLADRLGDRRDLAQLHLGGGTPTHLEPEQIEHLVGAIRRRFSVLSDADVAVEVDPRVTRPDHLAMLRSLGFRRLSAGVQDFDRDVQEAIGRVQPLETTRALVRRARSLGFASINLDLVYGLPRQTPESFRKTLDLVCSLRPDRLAVYSYAHVPWMRPHQKKLPENELPDAATKLSLFAAAVDAFSSAGYVQIGMDHFALPEDELGRAVQDGSLWRNFMGYTVRKATDLLALGASGISDVAGAFFQNERKLAPYERAVESGRLPVERGYVRTAEDELRREVITSLMCTFRLDFGEIERGFGISFADHFAFELEALRPLEADGLVRTEKDALIVEEKGRLFIRNVCMVFDAHLRERSEGAPRFSRTV